MANAKVLPKIDSELNISSFIHKDDKFDGNREQFVLGNSIVARGQFGILYMSGKHLNKLVAVKHADEFCKFDNFKALVKELKVLSRLNPHPNVLRLVGSYASVENKEVILAFEFCSNGNLLKMLRNSRHYYKNNFIKSQPVGHDKGETPVVLNFTAWNLLVWTLEITEALEFLSYNKVVHGDLATRNILLTCNYNAKICNFCLAKQLNDSSAYIHGYSKLALPMEWLAPESLRTSCFSLASDVWSFGILMWEIYSLGEVPYPDVDPNQQYWKHLETGYRLGKPKCATSDIYRIMEQCWIIEPQDRPSFSTIRQLVLQEIYKNSTQNSNTNTIIKMKDINRQVIAKV